MNAKRLTLCPICDKPDCFTHSDTREIRWLCGCCGQDFTDPVAADRCCRELVDKSDITFGRQKPSPPVVPPNEVVWKQKKVVSY